MLIRVSCSVGRKILTKRIDVTDEKGNSDMWNVTSFYKNPEGSEAERLSVYNAVKGVPKAQHLYDFPDNIKEDVFFDLVDIDAVPFGESFELVVNIENKADAPRKITTVMSATSIYYTGVSAETIKKSQGTFSVNPGQKEVIRMSVTAEEYLNKLVDHGLIKIYAITTVEETKQTWSEEDDFTLIKPEIVIQAADTCIKGKDCVVNFR